MKNYILFFTLGLMPFSLFAQPDLQCGTKSVYADRDTSEIPWYGNNQILNEYLEKNSKFLIHENHIEERGDRECPEIEEPIAIPIKFWIWQTSSNENPVSEVQLRDAIGFLNSTFQANGLNVWFYMLCTEYPVNANFVDVDNDDELHDLDNDNAEHNAINVHVVKSGITGSVGSWAGIYTSHGSGYIGMARSYLKSIAFAHEIGHYFGLDHTFIYTQDLFQTGTACCKAEPVTRGKKWYQPCLGCAWVGIPWKNRRCERTGDNLCDTDADPRDTLPAACSFIGTGNNWKDGYGELFKPNRTNIMSYYPSGCTNAFSEGQKAIMTEEMDDDDFPDLDDDLVDPDRYEPDNSSTVGIPRLIGVGEAQCHSMHSTKNNVCGFDDEDWFRVDNRLGMIGSYKITIEDVTGNNNPIEEITVYNTNSAGERTSEIPVSFTQNNGKREWELLCTAMTPNPSSPTFPLKGNDFLVVAKRGSRTAGIYKISLNNTLLLPTLKQQNQICVGQNWTVENLPAGANVNWTKSWNVTLSTTNGVTTQVTNVTSTPCWIAALIELNGCMYMLKNDFNSVGSTSLPAIGDISIQSYGACDVSFVIEIPPVLGAISYTWACSSNSLGFDGCYGGSGGTIYASAYVLEGNSITFTVTVTATNECGASETKTRTYTYTAPQKCDEKLIGGGGGLQHQIKVMPNPVSYGTLTIEITDNVLNPTEYQILITSQFGETKYASVSIEKIVEINSLFLPNGVYYAHVITDTGVVSTSFIVNQSN